jgi:hypothetical protein
MLYDSTRGLLQSILTSLETGDENRWDDRTESGNACLYEMHQMSRPLYKAYRADSSNASSLPQSSLPEKLNRAMPHVRLMVIAIRRKDQSTAIESGRAALAEMNGARTPIPGANGSIGPEVKNKAVSIVVRQRATIGKQRKAAVASGM